ncbi:hypothetical protein FOG51_01378 [Hanseniaspora uvarum]|uniref:Uncharacterized protein n=1 Tax=Hanseniaspora uvarum TaxID=29833 RepID=A0A1E5RQM4_HANUV|nr:hypothetical protein FOG48_04096 [Hanseniaspora uvarum]KAF0273807.1 hypothetical protein FOG51_01378 [Hanseniaspora uvarum]OEJ89160.1 hypothetical protein AWRI3580_g1973 [Hanseniaspora uvarum]GMM42597.1 hypothetical protein DAHU10_035070 [Hanseniaspora uvarum]
MEAEDDLKQLSLDSIKKDLKSLSHKIDDSNKTKLRLNLTPTNKERSDIMALVNEINCEFDKNPDLQKLNEYIMFQNLKIEYQKLLTPKENSTPQKKQVRFDVAEQDSHLDDIHLKLKMNKNRIINEIQPDLAYQDNILNDLEQGMDTGLLNLNTINKDSILPKWKKSGYSRTAEFKRSAIIVFLFVLLIVVWVL